MKFADSFRAARWVRLANLLLQAVLFLTLFAGLNFIALNHHWRFDLSAGSRFSLSPETRSYLERLERDVEVFVTFSKTDDSTEVAHAYRDIDGLLREYVYATRGKEEGRGRVTVRFVDVYAQRRIADELGLELPNAVVVSCENRRRNVTFDELYAIRNKGTEREAFKGEASITAAVLDVSSPDRKKIYFVQGHGELGPDNVNPNGLSTVADELRQRNFELASIDLTLNRKVPEDAALLIIAGPMSRFQPYEEELLRGYLSTRAGRVLLFLPPGVDRFGLENLFFDWGVLVYDNVIYDLNPQSLTETGETRLWNDLPGHPVTQNLINNTLPVIVGPTRVVSEDLGRSDDDGLGVKTLIATSENAWGEASYRLRVTPEYTPGQDLRGQLGVLVVSERVKPAQKIDFSVRGGRLAVMGTADVIANNRIFNLGNLNLFLALVNWAVDRDTQLNIPARPIQRFQLTLSQEELIRLRIGLLVIVPGAVGLLGLLVYLTRRN